MANVRARAYIGSLGPCPKWSPGTEPW